MSFRASLFKCKIKSLKNWFNYRRKILLKTKEKYIKRTEFVPEFSKIQGQNIELQNLNIIENQNMEEPAKSFMNYQKFNNYEVLNNDLPQNYYYHTWLLIPVINQSNPNQSCANFFHVY